MKVSLIGAGPGDPGLLTIKGREILSRADVVVYDALANADLLSHAKPGAELIYVGKIADQHALPQPDINRLLARKALEGKDVVRLKGGDPYIFGRGGEEGAFLLERGIPYEEIPGISSAIAAPAYAGIPVTHRDCASSVIIITGHERPDKEHSAHNWKAFAQSGSTLVFVMGVRNLAFICESLVRNGLSPDTPAAIIQNGTTPFQKTLFAKVGELAEKAAQAGLSSPAVIVVGKVVALGKKLDWFGAKPLLGRTIVVTRAREQASGMAAMLAELGANVLQFPVIEIGQLPDYEVLDTAIDQLCRYAWLIFTSVNGVKYFWQRLASAGKDTRCLGKCKVAAIGPATAGALREKGVEPDLVPETYVAESVAEAMIARDDLNGARILLPRAAEARMALPDALARAGAVVDIAPAYVNHPGTNGLEETRKLLLEGRIDCVAFGSSSTVRNFLAQISAAELKGPNAPILAAIGPVTAETLRENGLECDIEPAEYTVPGLVKAIAAHFSAPGNAQDDNDAT